MAFPTYPLAGCLILLSSAAAAQTEPGSPREAGRTVTIESRALGETRIVDVMVPAGYRSDSTRRYPVVYVLDGELEGEIAAAGARFYAATEQLPGLIVVGIRNVNRTRDLTPAPLPGFAPPAEAGGAGGADRFLRFLETELVPLVERSWRAAPMRVLVGHSLGGLLAFHALATRPALFQGYLVMEPSSWWNDGKHLEAARRILADPATRRARVVTVNTEALRVDTTAWGGAAPMVRELTVAGESHASMALTGMMRGLKTLFADFRPSPWRPGTRPVAMLAGYDSLRARVGYGEPIPASAFQRVIQMSLDSRWLDDAAATLDRMERELGPSDGSRELRSRLERARREPPPTGFVQLVVPARRPTPAAAAKFLGTWVEVGEAPAHRIEIRAAGDTIVVRDRIPFPDGSWFDEADPVIQVTSDGKLEWGLPWFRGLAALVVLQGTVGSDGIMTVTREPRGWVPHNRDGMMSKTQRFRRAAATRP